ncbi:MAG TPA: squalene--hopene cyclase [Burkholderiales bacterium]|nr:squalene--hopene cyclase [Burkholderiales bacterium]
MTPLPPLESSGLQRAVDVARSGAGRATAASALDSSIARAAAAIAAAQHPDGYWCYELEADCTIPAEYILMMHFMGEVDTALQSRIAVYLRAGRVAEDGWPLYAGGAFDLSCSVKAYWALKLAGDDVDAPHMKAARAAILAHGGAARANVFTRITLALFGEVPWRAVPFMPVEAVLLPRWFPFNVYRISYWSRTVMVPLLILCSLKARARNPLGLSVRELFTTAPEQEKRYFEKRSALNALFLAGNHLGRALEPLIPRFIRRRALRRAEGWFVDRLNGTGGLGAIFPAMVNAYEALDVLGYPRDDERVRTAREAIDRLLVIGEASAYCQPCVSPVWDTALACLALQETGGHDAAVDRAHDWLASKQLLDQPGDWRIARPRLPGGGWAFQFDNDYYPDLDDTGAVVWTLERRSDKRHVFAVRRAAQWICGMQSKGGGFGAFDADNTHAYLNEIPFADHGALLDPPTADVSARCALTLARLPDDPKYRRAIDDCIAYLRAQQEPGGAWFGRWGTNYIYGTWSVLAGLREAGVAPDDPAMRRAAAWLKQVQGRDGGWGEDNGSYWDPSIAGAARTSTAFQTAWAMLALIAAGEGHSAEVERGAQYLLRNQQADGLWDDDAYTAPGFPRVFFLKYHGYSQYFPLWALANYRNAVRGAE